MLNQFKSLTTLLQPPAAKNLLPPGPNLFPVTDGGSLLHINTEDGEALVNDISKQLIRAYSEANKLAVIFEANSKDWMANAKVGEIMDETLRNAKDTAISANAVIADRQKLQIIIASNGKIIAASLGGVAILVIGGWLFFAQQATAIAKDQIDGFIVRYNLRDTVSYTDISASPFGSATIKGVTAHISPNTTIKIASLNISDLDVKNNNFQGLNLSAKSVELPMTDLARGQYASPLISGAIGMGYTTLIGDVTAAVNFDDNKNTLVLETSGDIQDVGNLKFKIALGVASSMNFTSLYSLAEVAEHGDTLAKIGASAKAFEYLTELALSEANLTIDNNAYIKRSKDVTQFDIPQDDTKQEIHSEIPIDETTLVQAGMPLSEAKTAHTAIDTWIRDGGTLNIASNIDHPLSLFRSGSMFAPTFRSPADYLVVTKSKISN